MGESKKGFNDFLRDEREKKAEIEREAARVEEERRQTRARWDAERREKQRRDEEYARQQAPYYEELARELSKSTKRVVRAAKRQLSIEWLHGRWFPTDLGWYMQLDHKIEYGQSEVPIDPDWRSKGSDYLVADGKALTTRGEILTLHARTSDYGNYDKWGRENTAREALRRTDEVREVLPYSEEDLASIQEQLAKFCVEKALDV